MAPPDQYGIPCAYIRGGTSKALFFHEKDIPPPGAQRDAVLKRVMGSPDAHQIDGMGGTRTHTSKIAIVRPSMREDADVDFTFAQVGIDQDGVSYKGNCGNISSAVGSFAIDEGLVSVNRTGHSGDSSLKAREVRIYNTNTQKILISHVPVDPDSGLSVTVGNAIIDGVPGRSAPILMDYRNAIGGSRDSGLFPSTQKVDKVSVGEREVEITVCDIGNISCFVRAADVGISGSESASQITKDSALIARCKELRGKAAQLIGMCEDWEKVDDQSPGLPFVVLVGHNGTDDRAADLNARLIFANACHDSMAGTAAVCLAACSRVIGTVVSRELAAGGLKRDSLRIGHPEGAMSVFVKATAVTECPDADQFDVLAFERTARRIMTGTAFIPKEVWSGLSPVVKQMVPKTSLLMTGDINLLGVDDATGPFKKVANSLDAADIVISNFECILDTPTKVHSVEHEGFYADPDVGIEALYHGKIAAVGLANNINYGAANILGSIATLDKAGIPHTGAGVDIAAARKPVIVERAGRRYGFLQRTSVYWPTDHAADVKGAGVALPGHTSYEVMMYRYHSAIPPINRPGIPPIVTTWADPDYLASFTDDIRALRPQVDVLIASSHWGLGREVLTYMEQIAKAAIDAGADVVMGHGPHHPLPMGFHAGKPIFYGLGSFSFHMGHLSMAHGNWVGLLASLGMQESHSRDEPEVSFRFVRHNDQNETYLCHPED